MMGICHILCQITLSALNWQETICLDIYILNYQYSKIYEDAYVIILALPKMGEFLQIQIYSSSYILILSFWGFVYSFFCISVIWSGRLLYKYSWFKHWQLTTTLVPDNFFTSIVWISGGGFKYSVTSC